MDTAEIDVGSGIFECGQTYVALSRVKSLDGLYLTSYDVTKIKINKKVKEFYEKLTLYHESQPPSEETPIPIPIDNTLVATAKVSVDINVFDKYRYTELSEETYDDNTKL